MSSNPGTLGMYLSGIRVNYCVCWLKPRSTSFNPASGSSVWSEIPTLFKYHSSFKVKCYSFMKSFFLSLPHNPQHREKSGLFCMSHNLRFIWHYYNFCEVLLVFFCGSYLYVQKMCKKGVFSIFVYFFPQRLHILIDLNINSYSKA